jgi:hypothetical protein
MNGQDPRPLPTAPAPAPPSPAEPAKPPRRRWYQYLGPAVFALFCIELGVLLVLSPWIEVYEHNVYQFIPTGWQPFFLSQHFRGALSALGFLNFIIALNELIDLVRPRAGKQ